MLEELNLKLDTWMQTDDYKCQLKKQDKYFKSLREFLAIFTKDKIESMNIDEYVTGKKNQKAFCYWLEETLEFYGSISGRTTAYEKFVIYWDKEIKDYSFGPKKWKSRKGFGSTKDEIFENIKKSILDVVDATKNNDYERIINNPLNPQFKNKINFLYDYDNQIPIYSNEDLNVILTLFEIPFDKNIDRIYKREKLFEFYKNNGYDQKVSPALFMLFIYSWYGYRAILRTNEKPTIESKEIESFSLVDIKIDDVITSKKEKYKNELKRRIIYNPGSEESKRITGKKAEDIVLEYLKVHAKELDAHNITPWCYGENQDDGKGYDISYLLSNGTEIFVEVKDTKADLKGQVYFEMSRNEYNIMKSHPNTYYIFFVNDVNKGNIIQRILAKDVYGEEPIKYRVNFKSMLKDENENITLNDSEIKNSDDKIKD